jgi:hypothetical protein
VRIIWHLKVFSRVTYSSVPLIENWMPNECIVFFNVGINCGEMIFYTRRYRADYLTVTGFKYHVEFCTTKIPIVVEIALRLKCIVLPL